MIMLFVNAPSLKALMCWTNVVEGQRVHWDVELKIKNKKKNKTKNGPKWTRKVGHYQTAAKTTNYSLTAFLNVDVLALRGN